MINESCSDNLDKVKKIPILGIIYILLITYMGLIYFYHQSIQIYGQQTYHVDLKNYHLFFSDIQWIRKSNQNLSQAQNNVQTEQVKSDAQDLLVSQSPLSDSNHLKKIILNKNAKVFFAGDSLMQGIAPYVKKSLFKQYKIESINLSKQNTGLTYANAFDWPKKIEEVLTKEPLVKLLVVFLGPNDPWSLQTEKDNRYVRFKSSRWEKNYRNRIQAILNSAKQHQVQVLWLAAPCMKKTKLNSDIIYLNSLYQSETEKSTQHFLMTNEFLGCSYDQFSDFVEADKTKIKVRIDDGIHFTVAGQRILANAIMDNLIIN